MRKQKPTAFSSYEASHVPCGSRMQAHPTMSIQSSFIAILILCLACRGKDTSLSRHSYRRHGTSYNSAT